MSTDIPCILLVDDEPDILSLYERKLEKSGFRVVCATDGQKAIDVALAEHPNLILMDVKMPVMDGVAAQQKLKENPSTKDIKVVFLTAFSDPLRPELDETLTRESGAAGFIRKGINLDELIAHVREYLGAPSV